VTAEAPAPASDAPAAALASLAALDDSALAAAVPRGRVIRRRDVPVPFARDRLVLHPADTSRQALQYLLDRIGGRLVGRRTAPGGLGDAVVAVQDDREGRYVLAAIRRLRELASGSAIRGGVLAVPTRAQRAAIRHLRRMREHPAAPLDSLPSLDPARRPPVPAPAVELALADSLTPDAVDRIVGLVGLVPRTVWWDGQTTLVGQLRDTAAAGDFAAMLQGFLLLSEVRQASRLSPPAAAPTAQWSPWSWWTADSGAAARDPAVRAFLRGQSLPRVGGVRDVARSARFDALVFRVAYDVPDSSARCLDWCGPHWALGLKLGQRIGWTPGRGYGGLDDTTYVPAAERGGLLRVRADDAALFDPRLWDELDTLATTASGVDQFGGGVLLPLLLRSPAAPAEVEWRCYERYRAGRRCPLDLVLARAARRHDLDLLVTLALADSPVEGQVSQARDLLVRWRDTLLADPRTPERVLFLYAREVLPYVPFDSTLARRLLTHPHARGSLPILALLADRFGWVRDTLLSRVSAPATQKRGLALALDPKEPLRFAAARALVEAPDAERHPDVLLVLAYARGSDLPAIRGWAAHRLPAALLPDEPK
jgi:hypothetical protein